MASGSGEPQALVVSELPQWLPPFKGEWVASLPQDVQRDKTRLLEAFLHSDIAKSAARGCLPNYPPPIALQPGQPAPANPPHVPHKQQLEGEHVLMVADVRDISRPAQKPDPPVPEQGATDRRMLKLALTDGYNAVVAVEHTSIAQFPNESSMLGAKILVSQGPPFRRGILFLGRQHVKVTS